jgi:site-specific DNA-methyltransferase (cytosine-N4-specific)
MKPLYQTELGAAYCADSLEFLPTLADGSVDLVLTSPPYALHFKKEYGNADQQQYVDWFMPFAHQIKRVLKPDGSFVLNIGGSWTPGAPVRSLYHFRLLLALCDELGFHLCQEFFWYNPAKMPAPAEWVNVRRLRVKDSVEYIFWLAPSAFPKADNTKVLQAYNKRNDRRVTTSRPPSRPTRDDRSRRTSLLAETMSRTVAISGNRSATVKRSIRPVSPRSYPDSLSSF